MAWSLRVPWWTPVLGAFAGLGYLVLLQQYGMLLVTTSALVAWPLAGGAIAWALGTVPRNLIARRKAREPT